MQSIVAIIHNSLKFIKFTITGYNNSIVLPIFSLLIIWIQIYYQ